MTTSLFTGERVLGPHLTSVTGRAEAAQHARHRAATANMISPGRQRVRSAKKLRRAHLARAPDEAYKVEAKFVPHSGEKTLSIAIRN